MKNAPAETGARKKKRPNALLFEGIVDEGLSGRLIQPGVDGLSRLFGVPAEFAQAGCGLEAAARFHGASGSGRL